MNQTGRKRNEPEGTDRAEEPQDAQLATKLKRLRSGNRARPALVTEGEELLQQDSEQENGRNTTDREGNSQPHTQNATPAPRATGVDDLLLQRGYCARHTSHTSVDSATAARLAASRSPNPVTTAAAAAETYAAQADAVAEPQSRHGISVGQKQCARNSLPVDWTLKSSVRFFSHQPVHALQLPSKQLQANALDCLCNSNSRVADDPTRVQQALLSCYFPNDRWSQSMVSAVKMSDATCWHERVRHWRESFASAFTSVRSGRCEMLYCVFHQHFVALFCAPGIRGEREPVAILSRSSKSLRTRLAHWGIKFTMPLHRSKGESRSGGTAWHESISGLDDPASLVHTEGTTNVHLLFCCLRMYFSEAESRDVPTLIAPQSFLYSSICPATVRCKRRDRTTHEAMHDHVDTRVDAAESQQQEQQQKHEEDKGGEKQTVERDGQEKKLHSVELEGIVPPWVVLRVAIMLKEHVKHFELDARTMAVSTGLNTCAVAPEQSERQSQSKQHSMQPEKSAFKEQPFFYQSELSYVQCKSGRFFIHQAR